MPTAWYLPLLQIFAFLALLLYREKADASILGLVEGSLVTLGASLCGTMLTWLRLIGPRRGLYLARVIGKLLGRSTCRVSMAVLIRLEIDDDVVVVGNRKTRQPAALGGVLKYFDEAQAQIADVFAARPSNFGDPGDPVDDRKYKNDLRLVMPLKNLRRFLEWCSRRGMLMAWAGESFRQRDASTHA